MTFRRWCMTLLLALLLPAALLLPPEQVEAPIWARLQEPEPLDRAVGEAGARLRLALANWVRGRARETVRRQSTAPVAITLLGTLPRSVATLADSAAQQLWRLVPVGDSSIRLHVLLTAGEVTDGGVTVPLSRLFGNFVMAPDETDGRTCVLAVSVPWSWLAERPVEAQRRFITSRLREAIGPCALWRAFGEPSPSVSRWLQRQGWRPAMVATWAIGGLRPWSFRPREPYFGDPGARITADFARRIIGEPHPAYSMELRGASCLAGRRGACEAALLEGRSPPGESDGFLARLAVRNPLGPHASAVVNDLIQEQGRQRFAAFWHSPAAVPEAFQAAFGASAGDWAHGWMVRQYGVLEAGVPLRPGMIIVLVLVCTGLAVATAWDAARRQAT